MEGTISAIWERLLEIDFANLFHFEEFYSLNSGKKIHFSVFQVIQGAASNYLLLSQEHICTSFEFKLLFVWPQITLHVKTAMSSKYWLLAYFVHTVLIIVPILLLITRTPMRQASSPIYRCTNWDCEKWSNYLQLPNLLNVQTKSEAQISHSQSLCSFSKAYCLSVLNFLKYTAAKIF